MNRILATATLAIFLAAPIAACSTSPAARFDLSPVRANGQELVGLDSATTIESRQPGGIVSVRADNQFADFGASFIVAVQNKSGGALDFGPKNISATANGKPLDVLAADELDAQMKAQARGYLRATSRTGAVDVENATAAVSREYRFNNYGGRSAGSASLAYSDDQMAGGIVVINPPKIGGPVDLTVTFNGQKHSFTFNARPAA